MKKQNKFLAFLFVASLIFCSFIYCGEKPANHTIGFIQNRDSIRKEIESVLQNEFTKWYPISIDNSNGGFFSDLDYKWELKGEQNKFIVTQARHIWSNSNAATFYSDKKIYLNTAKHGFEFLKNKMWDSEFGGFYDLLNRKGEVIKEDGKIIKRAYGNSFAIYALAAYFKVSRDSSALSLAVATFNWLEKNSYDKVNGGYFQFMSREGVPFAHGYKGVAPKDQNSSIHLLECLTELYKVWPNQLLKQRLFSLMKIIRDTIVTPNGYMNLFFTSDWKPISYKDSSDVIRKKNLEFDHISFGHDIEIAYLLLEASEALGIENDSLTHKIAKKLVDHTINNGWDNYNGGIFDAGYYFNGETKIKIVKNTKEWWSQAEALNSLLMMSKIYPNDKLNYYKKFCDQWQYIKKFVLDWENGGWYIDGLDTAPSVKKNAKSSIWKCNYHTSRALINCARELM